MKEIVIVEVLGLFVLFLLVGFGCSSFFLRRFKKNNPEITYTEFISESNEKYWFPNRDLKK